MKQLIFAFCLIALATPVLRAQDVTPEDREMATKYLQKTLAGVFEATKGLSEAQWNFKPGTNRWSVAECVEHLASAEDYLMNMVQEKAMKAPPRTAPADVKAIDEMVMKMIPDRSHKAEAPEPLRPSNHFGSPQDSLKHLKESRAKTIAFLKKTDDLRQHAIDSPLGKPLDGFEWVLFVAAHSERHTKQMLEVKADPNFPKK